jgi:archaellum component FlaC
MAKELICKRHEKVIEKLKSIRENIEYTLKYDSEVAEVLAELLKNIDGDLYDCIDEIEEARESGQKMEDRLRKYKETIEDLGFTRN